MDMTDQTETLQMERTAATGKAIVDGLIVAAIMAITVVLCCAASGYHWE